MIDARLATTSFRSYMAVIDWERGILIHALISRGEERGKAETGSARLVDECKSRIEDIEFNVDNRRKFGLLK